MRKVSFFSILIIITIPLLITGCNNASTNTNASKENELQKLRSENEKVKEQLNESLQSIEVYKREQNVNKNLAGEEGYQWVKEEEWDKILVYKTDLPNEKIQVTDKLFLKNIYFANLMIQQLDPLNGPQSDVAHYTYEFIKGNNIYKVNVVGRDIIEFEGKYFTTNKYIYNLGKALLPAPKFIKTDAVLNKIYESGAVHGDNRFNYLYVDSFRIHGFVTFIQDGLDKGTVSILSGVPGNVGEVEETFTFYYYGEKLIMTVYPNYISIKDGTKTYWYKIDPNQIIFTVLTAG